MQTSPLPPVEPKPPLYPKVFDCLKCNLRLSYMPEDLACWTTSDYSGDSYSAFGIKCPSCNTFWQLGTEASASGSGPNYQLTPLQVQQARQRSDEWREGGYNYGISYGREKGYYIRRYPASTPNDPYPRGELIEDTRQMW